MRVPGQKFFVPPNIAGMARFLQLPTWPTGTSDRRD